jgi:hypothetical protein
MSPSTRFKPASVNTERFRIQWNSVCGWKRFMYIHAFSLAFSVMWVQEETLYTFIMTSKIVQTFIDIENIQIPPAINVIFCGND